MTGGATPEGVTGERFGAGRDAWATVNGVRLHWVDAGEGPLVVLLHGFPECWYAWRRQLASLAVAGRRAVAVDLRGYNLSDRPAGVEAYATDVLVEDVRALILYLGARDAVVVGHDWGGVIAWRLAARHPEVVHALVIVNAPHPERFRRLLRSPRQLLRSSYVALFQLPWLPERVLGAGGFAALDGVWRRQPVRPGAYSEKDIAALRQAIAVPGALTAALNYYRAIRRHPGQTLSLERRIVRQPTLVVWGERDAALVPELADGLEAWVPDVRVARLPHASHWVMADAPGEFDALLLAFLAEHSSARGA